MIQQLIDYNLRHGALSVRLEVRSLLCLLTRDNRRATEEMNNLIMTRITAAVKGHQSNPDMVSFCLPACVRAWCMCVVINAVFFKPVRKKGKKRMMVCASVHVCVCVCASVFVCECVFVHVCVCVCVSVHVCVSERAHIYVCVVESAVFANSDPRSEKEGGRKRVTVCDGTWK